MYGKWISGCNAASDFVTRSVSEDGIVYALD